MADIRIEKLPSHTTNSPFTRIGKAKGSNNAVAQVDPSPIYFVALGVSFANFSLKLLGQRTLSAEYVCIVVCDSPVREPGA